MSELARSLHSFIIGTGVAGERHAAAQQRIGVQASVYDIDPQKAQRVADKLGLPAVRYPRVGMADADVVFVVTPDHLHTRHAVNAVREGADIFIEKPMATNLRDAEKIRNEASRYGAKGWVGTNYRLTPAFAAVRERVQAGEAGNLLRIHSTYIHDMRGPHMQTPWRLGQDFLYGGGIHAIDLAQWVAGEPIVGVMAMERRKKVMPDYQKPEGHEITLEFQSGILGTVTLDARAPQKDHGTDLIVQGDTMRFSAHNKQREYQVFNGDTREETRIDAGTAMTVDVENQLVFDWLSGKRKDYAPLPDLDEAMDVMQVMDAIERSIQRGKYQKVSRDS